MDYTLHLNAIAAELNQIGFFLSPTGAADVGSLAASCSSAAKSLATLGEQVASQTKLLTDINGNLLVVANKIGVSAVGLATISSHLAEQVVTQQMVAVDQINNNKFTQETTKASQVAAGVEPTVITPANLVETTKETVNNVTMFKAQAAAGALVSDGIGKAASYATTTVGEWIAATGITEFIKNTYATAEIAVVGIFSEERAKKLQAELELKKNKVQAGGA
jgi:hypothetical protein